MAASAQRLEALPEHQIVELEHRMFELAVQSRQIHAKAVEEKRDMTADEDGRFNEMVAESLQIEKRVNGLRHINELAKQRSTATRDPVIPALGVVDRDGNIRKRSVPRHELRAAMGDVAKNHFRSPAPIVDLASRHEIPWEAEGRGLSLHASEEGGYLIVPSEWSDEIIKDVDDQFFILSHANIVNLERSTKLSMGRRTSRMNAMTWGGEKTKATQDTALKYGRLYNESFEGYLNIQVTESMLELGGEMAEREVREEITYMFGHGLETAMLTGNGVGKPWGLYHAHDDGIPTSRDVAGANTTTVIAADTLWDCLFNQKSHYWPMMRWNFGRTILLDIAKLKTTENQYIWRPGLQPGVPNTLLNIPYDMSELTPATKSAGSYVGGLFDYSQYQVVRVMDIRIQRLNERYIDDGMIGFRGKVWIGARPKKAEAFTRMKMADS